MDEKMKLPKGMGKIEEAKTTVKPGIPPAPFRPPSGQMPGPEVKTVEPLVPDPKPIQYPANVKKGEGITFIPKYKKFLAELKSSGQTYHVGIFDTEALAVAGIARAKAHLNP